MPTVFLNGKFLPADQAQVSVLDRGFVFGDGVYEVIPVYWNRLFRPAQHLERLNHSLAAIRMANPLSTQAWTEVFDALVKYNPSTGDQSLYVQITRGPARRDHAIPAVTKPTLFAMCNPIPALDASVLLQGVSVVTLPDIRWQYCHIKAITLLPNVLLRADAAERGAADAILIRDGVVTEGTASNVFVVRNGTLVTPPKSAHLLPGITRDLVLELAQAHRIPAVENNISADELMTAEEIWLTSSGREILPVARLNERPVGTGAPGAQWHAMRDLYQQYKLSLRSAA